MKSLSAKLQSIEPSVTLAVTAKAQQLKAEGLDVIGFGAGEPDFDTPENIKKAGILAIEKGKTKYTPAAGTADLKKAIAFRIKEDLGLEYKPNEIAVNCGAKHSIFNALQAICNPGDEIIIPAPYWVSYPDQVTLCDSVSVIIKTDESTNFKITAKQLQDAITPKTKAVILNSPSNPTGSLYTKNELQALADVIVKNDLYVISDEIYDKLLYDGAEFVSIATLGEEIKKRTLIVNGVSKSYSMTGWRIGYVLGDAKIIKIIADFQSHTTSNPTSISQEASVEALTGDQSVVSAMLVEFAKRRRYMIDTLNSIQGVTCQSPEGAFYVFPNVSACYGKSYNGKKINGSIDFSDILLAEAQVAVVPGAGFGADNNIRLSYATSMANIEKGLQRIKEFCSKLV